MVSAARVYQLYGGVYYYYGDFLETSRVMADENGDKCYDADYFPWGGEQYVFTNTCPQNYKFTGKERDPDMGIDDFGAPPGASGLAGFETWASATDHGAGLPSAPPKPLLLGWVFSSLGEAPTPVV